MNNADKITAIKYWQNEMNIHPLTCGHNSEHILEPKEFDGEVILECPEESCPYTQENVPSIIYVSFEELLKTFNDSMDLKTALTYLVVLSLQNDKYAPKDFWYVVRALLRNPFEMIPKFLILEMLNDSAEHNLL